MNKYHAKKTVYKGNVYDSKIESRYAHYLDMLMFSSQIRSWKRQVKFPCVVQGKKICDYIADFVVQVDNKTQEIREVKGVITDTFRIKKKLVMALYPNIKFVIITKKDI